MSDVILTSTPVSANGHGQPEIAREVPLDPFDPARLRLSQDFGATLGVKKAILTIPVRRPDRSWFIRTHPHPDFRLETAVIELREDQETYLVAQSLWPVLSAESTFSNRVLFTSMTRNGVLFLWPIKLPRGDGRSDHWNESAVAAATMAAEKWCRIQANMTLGAYEVLTASGEIPPPVWPDLELKDLLRIAFKSRYIDSLDHPVLQRLRGEV
jgi:hypothetical protein